MENFVSQTIAAHYDGKVLVLDEPVKLPVGQPLRLSVEIVKPGLSLARQTAGIIPWTGDAEVLERIATDPEFGLAESP
jgi:hypothetical protein